MKPSPWLGVAGAAAATLTLAACSASPATSGAPAGPEALEVMAATYPLQYATEQVGGAHVAVTSLTPPGVDAHDLELSPHAVAQLSRADLVVYLSGFQAAVDDAVAQDESRAMDVADHASLLDPDEKSAGATAAAEAGDDHADDHADAGDDHDGHDHSGLDPHFWLDPTRLADVALAIGEELATLDPANAADYRANAAALAARQGELDAELAEGLASCASRTIVVSHQAFGYLAERYDLEQVSIAGLDPDGEPSPARLAEVAQEIRAHGATTVFSEPGGASVAETLASNLGIDVAELNPLDAQLDADVDYPTAMRQNLAALEEALQCV